jgi:hypothetical protein
VLSGDGVHWLDLAPGTEMGENIDGGMDEAEAGEYKSALSSGLSPRW